MDYLINNYYGKEYDSKENILKLNMRTSVENHKVNYVYDFNEYIGKEVTISFELMRTEEVDLRLVRRNSRFNQTEKLIDNIPESEIGEWKSYQFTTTIEEDGYLGFGGTTKEDKDVWIYLRNLQVELGNKKTSYEEYKPLLQTNIQVKLDDIRNEITEDNYYIKLYQNNHFVKTEEYPMEDGAIVDEIKQYVVEENALYKIELVVRIAEREYILDTQEIDTSEQEIQGIRTKEEFLNLSQNGNYIVLEDIDLEGMINYSKRFGSTHYGFAGKINFNGHTLKTDTINSKYPFFTRIEENGIIENLVFEIKLNNEIELSNSAGLTLGNYGTIKNVQIKLTECNQLPNYNMGLFCQENYGTIENFVVDLQVPLYGAYTFSGLVYANRGELKNGYIYGENIKAIYSKEGANRDTGGLAVVAINGVMENLYSLIKVDVNGVVEMESVGNIAGLIRRLGTVRNTYSIGRGENADLRWGPTIGNLIEGAVTENCYYFADEIANNTYNIKTTELALYDKTFQKQILNADGAFEIEELIDHGYFPHVIMPKVMPDQEYISLPVVEDTDLPDILSTEVLEQGTDKIKVRFWVHNPSGETIQNITMKNINCDILSQKYESGKSEVIAELNNPIQYVSQYDVLSITTKGAYNLEYTRQFEEGERTIYVKLYREIQTVSDWKNIARSPNENYMLVEDLNFINEENAIRITNTFSGELNGNGHTIKNIQLTDHNSNLIAHLKDGMIQNINFENVSITNVTNSRAGMIGLFENSEIDRVNIKNMKMETNVNNVHVGGLVAQATSGTVQNCTIYTLQMMEKQEISSGGVGGLIGSMSTGGQRLDVKNCMVQNIELIRDKSYTSTYTGGIVGRIYDGGSISNSYAQGTIQVKAKNAGGIVGSVYTNGIIENCYSFVEIKSSTNQVGGIAGYTESTIEPIKNNLALGNIYTSSNLEEIYRIVGNRITETTENYAYTDQKINGYKNNNLYDAKELLSAQELTKKDTYVTKLKWGDSYEYSKVNEEILPKLYDTNGINLLPNQEDLKLNIENELEIEEVTQEKIDVNKIRVRVQISNRVELEVKNIMIDDMDTQIESNITRNGKTYLTLVATPKRYYDSYTISGIQYLEEGKEQTKKTFARIDAQFYKELYTYEDWQSIEIGTYQNYRLMNDIDFNGKTDVKTNVTIGRLESEGNQKALKNITAELEKDNLGLIQSIQTNITNIKFEGIHFTSKETGTVMGVIGYNNGDMNHVTFEKVEILADKRKYTGCIGKNIGKIIQNISLNEIKINGISYVGGLAGYIEIYKDNTVCNISGNDITVLASGSQAGGIFGESYSRYYTISQIIIQNSNIEGKLGNVGGLIGNGGNTRVIESSTINSKIKGKNLVGGLVGTSSTSHIDITTQNSTIEGTETAIGGILGRGGQMTNGQVISSTIKRRNECK